MNFELTKEQQMIRKMVREFAQNVIRPKAIEIDVEAKFPADTFKQMGISVCWVSHSLNIRGIWWRYIVLCYCS